MAKVQKNGPSRQGLKTFADGAWGKPAQVALNTDQPSPHKLWESEKRGGKAAFKGMETIGGQLWNGGMDPIAFTQGFDPGNTSGAVQPALDIMQQMMAATKGNSLQQGINPLGTKMGGDLYSQLSSFASGSSAQSKANKDDKENKDILDIIIKLVKKAMSTLNESERDKVNDRLDEREYRKIQKAYMDGGSYKADNMPNAFVNKVNELVRVWRKARNV